MKELKDAERTRNHKIESPIADCIVWFDGTTWKACIDTSCSGDLEGGKVLSSFRESREWEFISRECMVTYCVTIHDDGNLLEICVPYGNHGSHVAHIAAGHFPDAPEKNGLAPGAQIVSINVTNNSDQAFIRAVSGALNLKNNCFISALQMYRT